MLVSITTDLGNIGLVSNDICETYVKQHIATIRSNNPVQSELIARYLRSDYGQKYLPENKQDGGKLELDDIHDFRLSIISDKKAAKSL